MMATGRTHFVSTIGAFHGKTLGALSGTSKSSYRKPFGSALLDFVHLPLNDIQAMESHFSGCEFSGHAIAGVILEPVQGEGGIHICTTEYLRKVRDLCTKHGAMLIFDEVQTGMGRTGKWWGADHSGVVPDIMAVGKGFGGGVMPVGACIATEEAWKMYIDNPFLMTTTFGGNPLAMAAAIAAMEVVHSENLVEQARVKGEFLLGKIRDFQKRFPKLIKEVRGLGLMIGIEFVTNELGYEFSKNTFRMGVLVSGTLINAQVVRVEPPLTITQTEMDQVLVVMEKALVELSKNPLASKL
jgi:putrescine aminotransferase